jgi:hypothetical protein
MVEPKKLLVFLSHASQDKPAVRRLCKRLKGDGFDPWLDEERLLPGQDWSLEIEKAMRASDAILLCFSALSVAKEGYIQREYKRAMQYQEEKPEGTIFVIPIRLDDCEMPFSMRDIQWVDFPAGYDRLVQALNQRAGGVSKPPAPKKKAEEKKMPAKKKASRPTFHIEGGVHAQNVYQGDQIIYNAGRDIIKGDQVNTTITYAQPQSSAELAAILHQFLTQFADLKQQAGLNSVQKQMIESAEKKVAEAAEESAKPEPLGERIKTTLTEAKEYMDAIGGSLASAATRGTTIGGLLVMVAKLFGM